MTSCYSVKINSGGVCETDIMSEGTGMWRHVKHKEIVVNQGHLAKKDDPQGEVPLCMDGCLCKVEHKVSFGQFMLSAVTLGFVRKSTVRYACCQ